MDRNKKDIPIENLVRKITSRDVVIITTIIYFAIVCLYELYYCNFEFFIGKIQNYNFSLYRIIVYITIYCIYYKFKKSFIEEAIASFSNKLKCYFIYLIIFLTILSGVLSIVYGCCSLSVIIWLIGILNFNLFAIYISNNLLKNVVVICLTFGIIFSISITFNNQLDEKIHFLSSYSIALRSTEYEKCKN